MAKRKETKKSISYDVFLNRFKTQKLEALYFIYGDEEYLTHKTANTIIDRAIPLNSREFDFLILYGDDCSPYDIVGGFTTQPFFAERKVVWVKKFDSLKAADQKKVIDEFIPVSEDNVLILSAEKFDSRLKLSKQIMEAGQVIHCKRPYKSEDMLPWLKQEADRYKLRFEHKAALLFVNKVDLDFYYAANELEKLSLYCLNKKNVAVEDVQACTGDSKTHNIFDLYNSIGKRKVKDSLIIAENLMENNEAPVFIITMLSRFFCQIWKINALRAANNQDREIMASHINEINYYFRSDYLRYSRNYPLKILPRVFSLLLEADTELKSLGLNESLIIERMMFRIFALK